MKSSWKLVSLFGIDLELHISFVLFFILFLVFNMWFVPILIILFTSVAFHELCHSLVAQKNGMKVKKIAISMPESTLKALERERTRLGKTRSRFITMAIESLLRRHTESEEDQRYKEAYLQKPEPVEEIEAVATAAVATWDSWE